MAAAGTADAYEQVFGLAPEGVWSAPGRVNLIGEHTDYNGGLVLPFALAERTRAAIGWTGDHGPGIHLVSAQFPEPITVDLDAVTPGRVDGWAAYVVGVVWALGLGPRLADDDRGLAIFVDSDVPVGSGLSSSAALMCSVGLGLNEMFGLGLDRVELAARTQRVENDFVGAPTGGMDQRASLLCEAGHALRFDVAANTTSLVPFNPGAARLTVLVVDTRVEHANLDDDDGPDANTYAARRADCEAAASALGVDLLRQVGVDDLDRARSVIGDDRVFRRARHVVTENARVDEVGAALAADDWATVGRILTEAHASIRDDFEVSCPELDLAVSTMTGSNPGAVGARMTGGGFGGSAIGLVPTEAVDRVIEDVTEAFATAGFVAPHCFTATPSAGAARDL